MAGDRRRPFRLSEETRTREILTPEGVPINLALADIGQRIAAFVVDMAVIVGVTLLLVLGWAAILAAVPKLAVVGAGPALLALFLLWNFYFTWCELNWQGRTIGKRWAQIRSISSSGGPASADAIVARNLMRDVEFLLPLMAVTGAIYSSGAGWLELGATGWLILFAILPLLNKDRLRVGDLVAGTIVVRSPRAGLLQDLSQERAREVYSFTTGQLDVYGIYELQVLEEVLRGDDPVSRVAAMETVARKIMNKIRWTGVAVEPEPFLRAFYSALRGRLESGLLLGKRREDKNDK